MLKNFVIYSALIFSSLFIPTLQAGGDGFGSLSGSVFNTNEYSAKERGQNLSKLISRYSSDNRIVPVLRQAMSDTAPEVRSSALGGYSRVRDPFAVFSIAGYLSGPASDADFVRACNASINQRAHDFLSLLRQRLKSTHVSSRKCVLGAIGSLGNVNDASVLVAEFGGESDLNMKLYVAGILYGLKSEVAISVTSGFIVALATGEIFHPDSEKSDATQKAALNLGVRMKLKELVPFLAGQVMSLSFRSLVKTEPNSFLQSFNWGGGAYVARSRSFVGSLTSHHSTNALRAMIDILAKTVSINGAGWRLFETGELKEMLTDSHFEAKGKRLVRMALVRGIANSCGRAGSNRGATRQAWVNLCIRRGAPLLRGIRGAMNLAAKGEEREVLGSPTSRYPLRSYPVLEEFEILGSSIHRIEASFRSF